MVNRAIEREKQRTASKNYKLEITGTNHKLPRLDSEQAEKDRTDAIGKVEEKVNVYAPFMGAKGKAMIDKEFEKYVSETDPKVWSRRAKLSRDDAWYDFKGMTREEAERKQRDLEAKRAEEKRKFEDIRNMKEAISRAKEKGSKKAQAFFEYENELRNKYRDESRHGPEKYHYWTRATNEEMQKLRDLEAALVMRDKNGKWRVAKSEDEFWDDDWEYTENNQGFQKSVPQNAGVDCIIELEKFNPYHDARGKFATADGTNSRVDPRPGRVDRHNGKGQKKNSRNKNRDADNKPMSIEKALEGTNPHFNSIKGDYKNNCQRCVQVYEMRRRGMDVSAAPYPGRHNNIAWGIECFTKSGTHKEAGRLLKRNMSKKDLEAALNNAPINSRHVIYVKK